jgi:Protein of unknown function (DUF3306)
MPADTKTPEGFSLKRWSRRKLEAARESAVADSEAPVAPIVAQDAGVPLAPVPPVPQAAIESPLPPVQSLTIDSDFTAFLQPNVDEGLKRQALKRLFADPRFNVMDGLDVYIDDYTKSDPIPPDILARLMKHFDFMGPAVAGELPGEPAPAAATPTLVPQTPPPATEAPAAKLLDAPGSQSDSPDATDMGDSTPPR